MSESTRQYDFNTAITALPENGNFDEDAHRKQIDPLYRRIKAHDGVTTCHIARYGINVKYIPNVIKPADLDRLVAEDVAWAAGNESLGLFPLRGDKTPAVVWEGANRQPEVPSNLQLVAADFNTFVATQTPSQTTPNTTDDEAFAQKTFALSQALMQLDGVLKCEIYLRQVVLKFDTTVTTRSAVIAHMRRILEAASSHQDTKYNDVFPFTRGANSKFEMSFS